MSEGDGGCQWTREVTKPDSSWFKLAGKGGRRGPVRRWTKQMMACAKALGSEMVRSAWMMTRGILKV